MPISYIGPGPSLVSVAIGGGPSFVELGMSSDDDLPAIDHRVMAEDVRDSSRGDEVAERIYRGRMAAITLTLIKFDPAVVNDLVERLSLSVAATPGTTLPAQMGKLLMETNEVNAFFALEILPTHGGAGRGYRFPVCWLPEDGYRESGFGNTAKRVGLVIAARPDANGVLWTRVGS